MEKAFIILAHKNPGQVARLIQSLDDNHSTFFIHLDKNAKAMQFSDLTRWGTKIVFLKRVPTLWAGFNLVEATNDGLRAAMNYRKHFDFISLISGQHYPIKSNEQINQFLRNTHHRTFLEYTAIPDHRRWEPRGGLFRMDKYFFGMRGHQRFTAKAVNFLSGKLPSLARRFPNHMTPYGGSQWWTIDNYSARYILDFISNNTGYTAFHKHTFAPDELFYHTILLNADDEKVRSGITNNNLLYMNWPDLRKGHPEILTSADLPAMRNSEALFARKFDVQQDAEVLNLIDREREASENCRIGA